MGKDIEVICKECGYVWYLGEEEVKKNAVGKVLEFEEEIGTTKQTFKFMRLFTALKVMNQKRKELMEINKCSKCGSKSIKWREIENKQGE